MSVDTPVLERPPEAEVSPFVASEKDAPTRSGMFRRKLKAGPRLQVQPADIDKHYLSIVQLVKAYPNPRGEPIKVVDGFSLTVRRGEFISVIGHSGCGKSTVLSMVAGLNERTGGNIYVEGKPVLGAGPDRAVVFQAPCLMPWMSAWDNVMLGVKKCYPHGSKQERHDIVAHYMALVGLGDAMHRMPGEMSGGMQQRVGIARALALQPKVLLLDEPFGRLDSLTRMGLQDTIMDILDREKVTTMLITHDPDEAVYMSDRICMMTNGPRAKVGKVMDIPLPRPRVRKDVLGHPDFYELRENLVEFLAAHEKKV